MVDLTTETSEIKVSTTTGDKSEPNVENNEVGRRTTGKNIAEEYALRRTTDLWPENPMKKEKLDRFAKPLMMVGEVGVRIIFISSLIVIRKAQRRE